jgi:CheY-like chemotaxis protein
MAGGLAHEINNPLAYMSPNIEFVLERLRHFSSLENTPQELAQAVQQDCAEMITALTEAESGAERIRRLVLSLKNFTRRETAERAIVFPPDLLDSVASYTASASKHHIPVVKECGPTPHVEANEQELTQALTNIAINAAQAIKQSPGQRNAIVLRTATDNYGRAVIEIEDTGHGIHPSNLSRVFDPFFTTRAAAGHIGLGLAFSRDIIVNNLGGELSIERTSDRGTTFRITLPPAAQRDEEEPTTATQHARILIIDDEPFVARAIERILQPSYEVTTAASAADALSRLADGEKFGAILCDLTMAEMNGPEFFSVLSQRWPNLTKTVIFITGGATSDSIVDFVASCSRPVIAKPLDAPKLRAKIESVLREV